MERKQTPLANTSLGELQRRYTERSKLVAEEDELLKAINKVETQLTNLQVEASDIKSRIRTTAAFAKEEDNDLKQEKLDVHEMEVDELEIADKRMDLDLSTNHVMERMMGENFARIGGEDD